MDNPGKDIPKAASRAVVDPYAALAAGVLAQAAREAQEGDLGAATWLLSDWAAAYCEVLGLDGETVRQAAERWAANPAGRIVLRMEGDMKIKRGHLDELRAALGKLDPDGRKIWALEFYVRRDGADRLDQVINIRTGKPFRKKDLQRLEAYEARS